MRRLAGRIVREPLVHFLGLAALLFALYSALGGSRADEDRRIVVTRDTLLNRLQYEAGAFQPEFYSQAFDALSPAAKQKLISRSIDDEVLYRLARANNLEGTDDVIRRRLVQKAQFILNAQMALKPPGETELRRYYAENSDRYAVPARLTFSHLFFSDEHRGKGARAAAQSMLRTLRRQRAVPSQVTGYGDRFPFLTDYVEQPYEVVASQLGGDLTAVLANSATRLHSWIGPFHSPYGWHIVYIIRREPARHLRFEEARQAVESDFFEERKRTAARAALDRLRSNYKIRIEIEPGA